MGFASQAVIPSAWRGGVTGRSPFVFLHGAGADATRFLRLGGLVENRVAVDLPGHGEAPGEPLRRIEDMAEAVGRLLDHEGWERPILVGHSMGGAVALTLALNHQHPGQAAGDGQRDLLGGAVAVPEPDRALGGLGLLGTATRLRVAPAFLRPLAERRLPEPFVSFLYGSAARAADVAFEATALGRAVLSGLLYADLAACDVFDVSSRAGELRIPACIVTGSEDRMTPPNQARRLAEWFGAPELVSLELVQGSGHYVMLERPTVTAAALNALRGRAMLGRASVP